MKFTLKIFAYASMVVWLPMSIIACLPETAPRITAEIAPEIAPETSNVTNVTSIADEPTQKTKVTVYKSATCGCCKEWVTYLEEEGYQVNAIDHDDMDSIKVKFGLPSRKLHSCHTAIVDGYVIEGHVPVNDIQRLLSERPSHIHGLSAPGMPMMSPGMGSRTPKDYDVLSFSKSGDTQIYSQY